MDNKIKKFLKISNIGLTNGLVWYDQTWARANLEQAAHDMVHSVGGLASWPRPSLVPTA